MIRAIIWLLWGFSAWLDNFYSKAQHKLRALIHLDDKYLSTLKGKVNATSIKWSEKTNIFIKKSRDWALSHESPEKRESRRRWMAKVEEGQTLGKHSVMRIYETLKLHILITKWEPVVKHFYFVIASFVFFNAFFMPIILLVSDQFPSKNETFINTVFALIALISLLMGSFVFFSVLQQLDEWSPRLWLIFIVLASFMYWAIRISSHSHELHISFSKFLILAIFCVAGILSKIAFLAYAFQWRIVYGPRAIVGWAILAASSSSKQETISRIGAWLVYLAPNQNGSLGWQTHKEIDLLAKTSSLDREGAEWRTVIFAILALIGLSSLGDLAIFISSMGDTVNQTPPGTTVKLIQILLLVSPTLIISMLGILMTGWALLLEIWLTELPNQIISSACIQLQNFLENSDNDITRSYENYRMITTSNPDSINKGFYRWNLIDKRPINEEKWRCLVEAQVWIKDRD